MRAKTGTVVTFKFLPPVFASLILAAGMAGAHAQEGQKDGLSSGSYELISASPVRRPDALTRVSVGEFSPAMSRGITGITGEIFFECTAEQGLVSTGDYSQIADFIRSALIQELNAAGLYSRESLISLSGELLNVDLFFDQFAGEALTGGTWRLQLKLMSSTGAEEIFTAGYSYPIQDPSRYCQEMAIQFGPGIQRLLDEILSSERFVNLAGRT